MFSKIDWVNENMNLIPFSNTKDKTTCKIQVEIFLKFLQQYHKRGIGRK